jgi:hypothetical protein
MNRALVDRLVRLPPSPLTWPSGRPPTAVRAVADPPVGDITEPLRTIRYAQLAAPSEQDGDKDRLTTYDQFGR